MESSSLFDAPESPIEHGVNWLTGTLLGSVAVTVCVIAIAALGLAMLGGWLPVRRAAVVILGCFVLLGAPLIAAGFGSLWSEVEATSERPEESLPVSSVRPELPPSDYDPYAGASLRQD